MLQGAHQALDFLGDEDPFARIGEIARERLILVGFRQALPGAFQENLQGLRTDPKRDFEGGQGGALDGDQTGSEPEDLRSFWTEFVAHLGLSSLPLMLEETICFIEP
jgi:hypothetical protein